MASALGARECGKLDLAVEGSFVAENATLFLGRSRSIHAACKFGLFQFNISRSVCLVDQSCLQIYCVVVVGGERIMVQHVSIG